MPKKSAVGRGRKREGDGDGGSPPSVKFAKTVAEGSSWRNSTIKERDLLRLVAERALYLKYTIPRSLSGCHAQWFYIGNHQPSLPKRDNSPPQHQECWLKKPTEEECRNIPELMQRIKVLKDKGVTGESVAYSFIE
ncbi:retrotransposon protein, putative, unclassified [Panicum miliaceum]|uniref:Retrotransposon protein, putative, unclassified n=1 Tax=Panicum miliaceum TaxID=4540 RepID=A0A3L6RRD7_PANMI|nr:retrotransposon protein, putative, unclassified [Panicum miliaceum]